MTTHRSTSDQVAERPRVALALDALVPDPDNRPPDDDADEDWLAFVDSVRLLGVLQALQVVDRGDGTYGIIEGHRRWRAARAAGQSRVPCDVWPPGTTPRDLNVIGLVANVHRRDHGCVHIARKLRATMYQFGETREQVAERTGIPYRRVKAYLAIINCSEHLLTFFEKHGIDLSTAEEFVRYEKATNEAASRKLVQRYLAEPLSVREIAALRTKRAGASGSGGEEPDREEGRARVVPRRWFIGRARAAFQRDRDAALHELEELVSELGYELVRRGGAARSAG